jgi:hypothetical protein
MNNQLGLLTLQLKGGMTQLRTAKGTYVPFITNNTLAKTSRNKYEVIDEFTKKVIRTEMYKSETEPQFNFEQKYAQKIIPINEVLLTQAPSNWKSQEIRKSLGKLKGKDYRKAYAAKQSKLWRNLPSDYERIDVHCKEFALEDNAVSYDFKYS